MRHVSRKFKLLFTLFALLSLFVGCSEGGGTTPDPDVPNDPAAPRASFSADPMSGSAPLLVTLDASDSTAAGGVESYAWDFGDGGEDDGVSVQHTFEAAGTYEVTLSVTDLQGLEDSTSREIRVTADRRFTRAGRRLA